jgi:hypothetical protein
VEKAIGLDRDCKDPSEGVLTRSIHGQGALHVAVRARAYRSSELGLQGTFLNSASYCLARSIVDSIHFPS